ncbi:MAG TPA: tetratricopeptide repeat protein, partial [Thermoanaerobaculia bacterium]|nr:tetratricopeptide repeat protein [Thermoanaerobaculia bacterium]
RGERQLGRQKAGREREARVTPVAAPVPARSPLGGFLWGAGSMAVIAALVFWVGSSAGDREGSQPITGTPGPMASADPSMPPVHPDVAAMQARVQQNPEDLVARLDLARMMLVSNDLMGVFDQTQFVLDREPDNARALSYQALVRLAMGQPDQATLMLRKAIDIDPNLIDGWLHLAIVYANTGNIEQAEEMMAEAERRFPQERPMLAGLVEELRTMASQANSRMMASNEPNPHDQVGGAVPAMQPQPGDPFHPPLGGGAQPVAAGPAVGPGGSVSGIIHLEGSVRGKLPTPVIVYLMARAEGVSAGPPLAVKRIQATSFPLSFTIGMADSMMGQPLPERIALEARVDTDGDAATREADAPSARLDGVITGSNSVKLVLAPRS